MKLPFRKGSSIDAAAAYRAGVSAFEQGRFAEAIRCLAPLERERSLPGTLATFYLGQAHLKHGVAELRAGRYDEAARHLTEAKRINPDAVGLAGYLTACFVAQRRFDFAAGELELQRTRAERSISGDSSAAEAPAATTLPIRLAYAFMRDGRLDRAVETLQDAIRKEPSRADLHKHLGLLLAQSEEIEPAIAALREAIRLDGEDTESHVHLAMARGLSGRMAEAAEHLSLAQRLRPNDAHIAMLLSVALKAREEQCAAAGASVIETKQDNYVIDPVEEAAERDIAALGEILAGEPDFVEAFLGLPESDIDRRVFALLAKTIERALERHPSFADLRYHCSRIYARLGRTDEAIAAAEGAVRVNPRFVQALIQLGRLYAGTRRNTEAIERLLEAIDAGGDYPDVHFLLGEMYRGHGDLSRARGAYERALKLNANYVQARQALESLAAA